MNYLYATDTPYSGPSRPDLVLTEEKDGLFYYLSGSERSLPGWILVGAWENSGIANFVSSEYGVIRPLGNEAGMATDLLDYHSWQGHAQRHLQTAPVPNTLPEYPEDTQPVILTFERVWDDSPGWEGWGWRATIEFSDPERPPNARAIGIYDANWNYLYTTGAFVFTDTGEVDEDGNPIMKWQTVNPVGRATAEKEPWYFSLLWGSIQEGQEVLPADSDLSRKYYWDRDQGGVPVSDVVAGATRAALTILPAGSQDNVIMQQELIQLVVYLESLGWLRADLLAWMQPVVGLTYYEALVRLVEGIRSGALVPPA